MDFERRAKEESQMSEDMLSDTQQGLFIWDYILVYFSFSDLELFRYLGEDVHPESSDG